MSQWTKCPMDVPQNVQWTFRWWTFRPGTDIRAILHIPPHPSCGMRVRFLLRTCIIMYGINKAYIQTQYFHLVYVISFSVEQIFVLVLLQGCFGIGYSVILWY